MSRPTKEEARGWTKILLRCWDSEDELSHDELKELLGWHYRLIAVLPSAAVVQRDRERGARPRPVKASENDEGPIDPRHLPAQEE